MNTITKGSESHDFATVAELLAIPAVKRYAENRTVSSWAYNENVILAAVGNPPIWHEVGRLKERVVLPKVIRASVPREPG